MELLAPAGSPQAIDAAIGEGADAVYLGIKHFNAGMRGAGFSYSQFEGALRCLHRMGRRLYVMVDTVFEQREADRIYQLLKYLAGLGPDAIMVQDFGIIEMVRDNFPALKLFASARMNVSSSRGANLLSRYGFSRVALARELSLEEISGIRSDTNVELEVFVHGELCVSVSGLCLFSSYLGGKSANRGMCTRACRRLYSANEGKGFEKGPAEKGGYYFCSGDRELIETIPELAKAGLNSFRIGGRMRSAEYEGAVVSAYRLVMDNLDAGEEALAKAVSAARGILKNNSARSKIRVKRYTQLIPRSLEAFNRRPGRAKAPPPAFTCPKTELKGKESAAKGGKRKPHTEFPEGYYAMVSRIEDLYVLQSVRPEKVILTYNRKTVEQLLDSRNLPFPPRNTILSLDPFFPREKEAELQESIPALMEKGYVYFIVNNLGHFSIFRGGKALLIAGPWLYAFNAWARAFVSNCGAAYHVSPLENSRQNLDRSFLTEEKGSRSFAFVTIFARPSLFRIREDLGKRYGFENFTGSRDEDFRLASGAEGSLVYPRETFSIVDKTPFLRDAGFGRFILDFSSGLLKKAEYRDIMEAARIAAPLPGCSRFNWKNGFYREPL